MKNDRERLYGIKTAEDLPKINFKGQSERGSGIWRSRIFALTAGAVAGLATFGLVYPRVMDFVSSSLSASEVLKSPEPIFSALSVSGYGGAGVLTLAGSIFVGYEVYKFIRSRR